MYQQFGLQNRPFGSIATAPGYFPASAAEAALDSIRTCVQRAAGPALLIGGAGLGKSQILAVAQQEFRQAFRVVHVQACSRMSRRHDLLQNILFELGQPYRQLSEGELRLALIDFLRPTPQCPHGILLLVDDGHTLSGRLLDELRLIHNFVRDGQPRVRLVLAGTQELEERLTHPQLESLQQRIAVRCYLTPFRRDEIAAYLQHQLHRAGGSAGSLFQPSAIQAVAQLCEGNPRLINQVCDHALMLAESTGSTSITGDLIAEAYSDIQQIPVSAWHTPQRDPQAGSLASPAPAASATPAPLADSGGIVEFGELAPASPVANPDEPPALAAIRPAARNPFAEPFEREQPIPNVAKPLAGKTLDWAGLPVDAAKQRIDPSEPTVGPGHFVPPLSPLAVTNTTWVVQTDLANDLAAMPAAHPAHALPYAAALAPAVPSPSGQPLPPETAPTASIPDDRDMIVVGSVQDDASALRSADVEIDHGPATVSRGKALRVEYDQLFQRLRSGKP